VRDDAERQRALAELGLTSSELMVQTQASGVYCEVQALFDHGKLLAAHTSQQQASGMGGSAAARLSVDHDQPRGDVERLGAYLDWHGGLTLDYLFDGTSPTYIECNPRTAEPGNAVTSGVDIPELQVRLSAGRRVSPLPCARLLLSPDAANSMAGRAVSSYSIGPDAIAKLWQVAA
jgi:hypothetical protein